jgi:nucleotide-binding universal stress UspA family protein
MKNNKNILCIVNESDINVTMLWHTIRYARENNAHIHFLRIIDSCKSISSFFNIPLSTMKATLNRNLRSSLSMLAPDLSASEYSCHVREGVWFIAAIQEAVANESQLIIIAEPASHASNFNSNVMHVIRKSPIPVLVLRKNISPENIKVLISVDIDLNDPNKKNANEKCIDLAKKLSATLPAASEVSIAHCWSLPNEKYLHEIANQITINQINEMSKRQRHFHEEWFHAFCDKHQDLNLSHAYFIKGESQIEIPDLIADEKIDILIINTVDDIKTAGLFISSSAETILESTHSCSSLTIKPDGFLTPVAPKLNEIEQQEDSIL